MVTYPLHQGSNPCVALMVYSIIFIIYRRACKMECNILFYSVLFYSILFYSIYESIIIKSLLLYRPMPTPGQSLYVECTRR